MRGRDTRVGTASESLIRVLAVDDDRELLSELGEMLRRHYHLTLAVSVEEALQRLAEDDYDAVLLDLDLGERTDGWRILEEARAAQPNLPIVMLSKSSDATSAVTSFRKGADDYLQKPAQLEDLEAAITAAIAKRGRRLAEQSRWMRKEIDTLKGEMIGESAVMERLRAAIGRAARGTGPILIVGETGTGKELVARAIHRDACPGEPFLPINVGRRATDLAMGSLFGWGKGAHSTAFTSQPAVFEAVQDGVLFLDEITEMDPGIQVALLRVIENREFQRLGERTARRFTGRVVAATNADLDSAIRDGCLRKDLYYRLNAFVLRVPSLRERLNDIGLLARYFAGRFAAELREAPPVIGPELMQRLCDYDWPGNVRELRNAIEALVMTGELSLAGECLHVGRSTRQPALATLAYDEAKRRALEAFQRPYLLANLDACGNNQSEAARRMGVSRTWLGSKLAHLGIEPNLSRDNERSGPEEDCCP